MALLIVLFIAVPIAEIYVIIKVGELIGVWLTIALLIADAVLGSMLLRHQGRAAWRRFNAAIAERRFPGREAADGVMVAVGGTLLLTPGFITDIAGLLLLVPPTRALIRAGMFRYLRRRVVVVGVPGTETGVPGTETEAPEMRPYDFEGSAREMPSEEAPQREGPGQRHLPP